jgi:hypothetical protein
MPRRPVNDFGPFFVYSFLATRRYKVFAAMQHKVPDRKRGKPKTLSSLLRRAEGA